MGHRLIDLGRGRFARNNELAKKRWPNGPEPAWYHGPRTRFPISDKVPDHPKNFWMSSSFAAELLGCRSSEIFRKRYLTTGRLPYIVQRYWSGSTPGRKIQSARAFVPRAMVHELVAELLMIQATKLKSGNYLKRRLAVIKGLDEIAKTVDPFATPVIGHQNQRPHFRNQQTLQNYLARQAQEEANGSLTQPPSDASRKTDHERQDQITRRSHPEDLDLQTEVVSGDEKDQ
jgi:hypothetical protein